MSVFDISVVMPPLRDMIPTWPGANAFCASSAGPPMPPILDLPGEMRPSVFGPMTRAPCCRASSSTCTTWPLGMRSVTSTTSLTPLEMASNAASFAKATGTLMRVQSTRVRSTISLTLSYTGTPCTLRPLRPGVTPPTMLEPYWRHSRVAATASRPVMPWMMYVVFSSMSMDIYRLAFSTAILAPPSRDVDLS